MGALLATLSLGVAAVFAAFVVHPRCGRTAAATHALMGLGMAAMFWPWGDPVPPLVGAGVFAALAFWFGARGVPTGSGGAAHLVVAPAAMAAMYLSHDLGGHHASGFGVAALWLALAGYFGWHAAASAARAQQAWVRAPADGVVLARPRQSACVESGAHVVMSGLMAAMFLTAL
jgi:hypothetical protein